MDKSFGMNLSELKKMAEESRRECSHVAQEALDEAMVYYHCHGGERTTFMSIAGSLVDWVLNESDNDYDHADRWWEPVRKLLEPYISYLDDYLDTHPADDPEFDIFAYWDDDPDDADKDEEDAVRLALNLWDFHVESRTELLCSAALEAANSFDPEKVQVSEVFLPKTIGEDICVSVRWPLGRSGVSSASRVSSQEPPWGTRQTSTTA